MSQVADVIDRVVRQLLSGTVEERNKLSANVSTSATTISLTYELNGFRQGSVVEINGEQMYVWSASSSGNTLTVERGFNGTTPSIHSAGAIVTNNPRFPRNQILEAINAELDDLSSPVNGLYRMVTTELSYNGTDRMIDLEGSANPIELYEVRYRYLSTDYPRVRNVQLIRNMPTADFPSGNAIIINDPFPRSGTFVVSFKAGFGNVASESEDLVLTSGLPASAEDVVVLGAQLRLVAPREIKRNFTESQGDTRRADEVPPSAVASSMANLSRMRRDRVTAEAMKLARQYPLTFRG